MTSPARSRWTCSTPGRSAGPPSAERAWRNLRFLRDAFDASTGRFRNFRRADGTWIDGTAVRGQPGAGDARARAPSIATSPDGRMVALAASLFTEALPEAASA